jgi:pimeloyl-ACP methyl ester carboxylesterase
VLQENGFGCRVPDLTGVATMCQPYYPKYAVAAAAAVDDTADTVVVVGHSAAGALLPAIAEAVGDRTRGAVFVDAMLPQPGRSWFDSAPPALRDQLLAMAVDGLLPPWHEWSPPGAIEELVHEPALRRAFFAEIPRLPVAYFEERAPVTSDLRRCAFLRLSAAYDRAADEAERLGWWVARRDWDHLRMLSAPEAVADLIALAISTSQAE